MSKFSVSLILNKDIKENNIEKEANSILYDFSSQCKVEPYIKYTAEEMLEKFNNYKKNYKDIDKQYFSVNNESNIPKIKDLESFVLFYADYGVDSDCNCLSNINPNAKFKDYKIGGRYSNSIKTKEGIYVTFSRIKNIIFKQDLTNPKIVNLKKMYDVLLTEGDFFVPEYYKERYPRFEDFLNDNNFSTYSILDYKGNWIEAGPMKQFGISSATPKELLSFQNNFESIINSYDENDWLVIVECSTKI